MKQTATPKGEHQYKTYSVAATCMNPGYTVRECSVCGDRHIEDITSVLPHNYESHVIAATCEGGGKHHPPLRWLRQQLRDGLHRSAGPQLG